MKEYGKNSVSKHKSSIIIQRIPANTASKIGCRVVTRLAAPVGVNVRKLI